jgi:hypothetical protein
MTKETKVDPNADVSNPRMLVFPQDPTGFLYKMKAAVLSAVERQNGNAEKHEQFMETIVVLAQFAKRRYNVQRETRDADVAAAVEAAAKLNESAFTQEVPDDAEADSGAK